MAVPLLALGPHVFEIAPLNFQALDRQTEAMWPAVPRFGNAPGRQFTGYGENPVTISGLLYPEEFGGRGEFEAIRATQAAALPVMMVGWAAAGTAGRVFGKVVILSVSDTQSIISASGQGRRLEYTIDVAPHGDSAGGNLGDLPMTETILPAAKIRVTREDASLEQLCFEYALEILGNARKAARLAGYVEAAIEANRGIAAEGLVLPLGTEVNLPEWRVSNQVEQTRLWD